MKADTILDTIAQAEDIMPERKTTSNQDWKNLQRQAQKQQWQSIQEHIKPKTITYEFYETLLWLRNQPHYWKIRKDRICIKGEIEALERISKQLAEEGYLKESETLARMRERMF